LSAGEGARLIAGRYQLRAQLGEGGHGDVWEAIDRLTHGAVAVKLLRPGPRSQRARVRREVSALRLLRIPGVVALLDEGMSDEQPFLVMERVEGRPFPGAPVPCRWPVVAKPAVALIETLARVHAAGVVHRDLKPANVLVADDGRTTLLDFGLSVGGPSLGDGLTEEGELLGTPAYLAPEQISGEPITARTDLYALGVMLYVALSGRLPHEASSFTAMMRARLTRKPVRLADLAPDVPARVAEAVERLLAIDTEERPRSASELLALLHGLPALSMPTLPWLGEDAPIRALVRAAREGRSLEVGGVPGSGRTRCLAEVASILAKEGRRVVHLPPARRPFASLEPLLGPLDDHGSSTLAQMITLVDGALGEALGAGVVLLVDDVERIDRASLTALDRCTSKGSILRARRLEHASDAPALRLGPLGEAPLSLLFAGPDRLFHLREDAAHALFQRSAGLPSRVAREIDAWIRAGLARWDDTTLVMDRDALLRLDAGLVSMDRPAAPSASAREIPAHLDEWVEWVTLAAPHATAALLAEATGQARWRLDAELDELIALGAVERDAEGRLLATVHARAAQSWSSERRRAAHRALATALPAETPERLFHRIAGSDEVDAEDARTIAVEACSLGRRLAREGTLGKAVVVTAEGLRALRGLDPAPEPELEALFALWVEVALADGTQLALDRVLYELCRAEPRTALVVQLEALIRAALGVGVWTEHAVELAEELPPFANIDLERRRHGVRFTAARRCSLEREEAIVAEIAAWAESTHDREAHASFAGWLGRLRYRQGRYDEAAELHRRAAELSAYRTTQIGALLNGASSLLEAFAHAEAQAILGRALALARSCRHTFYEARAEWLLRAALYRSGVASEPDHALLEAFAHAGVAEMEGFLCLNEAAVAWRAGQRLAALALSRRANEILARAGEPSGALLATCLEHLLGPAAPLPAATVDRVLSCPLPRVRLQALGLVALAGGVLPCEAKAVAERDQDAVAASHRALRMEILSADEALGAVAGVTLARP
jgi:tetratricopeptide (TPR) repeat protein